jgi:hypothetical protein
MYGDAASLRRAVGHDMFYSMVASFDSSNAATWLVMVEVQAMFARAEPGYGREARTYSESMRATLHWSLVFTAENPTLLRASRAAEGGLLGTFVRLHPTAFKANGACTMSIVGMAQVSWNTHPAMMTTRNIRWLNDGFGQRHGVAERAAEEVRRRRASCGESTTRSGYGPNSTALVSSVGGR